MALDIEDLLRKAEAASKLPAKCGNWVPLDASVIIELITRLKAAEAGWQPIETAPKDGSAVLVFPPTFNSHLASIARWDEDKYSKRPRPYWSRSDSSYRITVSRENPPTHWRPLPAAPNDARAKEKQDE